MDDDRPCFNLHPVKANCGYTDRQIKQTHRQIDRQIDRQWTDR